jgi:hypothetical protein
MILESTLSPASCGIDAGIGTILPALCTMRVGPGLDAVAASDGIAAARERRATANRAARHLPPLRVVLLQRAKTRALSAAPVPP